MDAVLNMGCLLIGLAAWTIPVVLLFKRNVSLASAGTGMFVSLICMAVALWMQIINTRRIVGLNDWSALLDTQGAVVSAAGVLLVITTVLNALLFYRSLRQTKGAIR